MLQSLAPLTLPQPQRGQFKQYYLMSVIAPLTLFFVLIIAIEITVKQNQLRNQDLHEERLSENTNDVRNQFEYELSSTLHLATGLVAYIQVKKGDLIEAELAPWLTNLQEHSLLIRNIGIAPHNIITFLYPRAGNEGALGLYYPDSKEQWPDVEKTIKSHHPILAGPVTLKQGGLGLIYRIPVFLDNDEYWGLVSTVLNFDQIYAQLHKRAEQLGIKIAIKDLDNKGNILFGDKDLIEHHTINMNIPGRHWQMISNTNELPAENSQTLRIVGWAFTIIISLLFYYFMRSVAKQHQTLYELNKSKYRFAQIFDTAPQGIALIKHSGALIDFNQSLCDTLGYTQTQLELLNFFDIIDPNQRTHLNHILSNPSENTHNRQYESALVNSHGQSISIILSLAPLLDDSAKNEWVIQIIDISYRIEFEQRLKEEANYNLTILNAVADGIVIFDTDGIVRSANPAVGDIFNYPINQMLHQHIGQYVATSSNDNIMVMIQQYLNNADRSLILELIGIKAKKQQFPLEIQLSSMVRKGEKLLIVVMRDLSERKRLDTLKQEFISTISHELRTPLTSIVGALGLLNSGALGALQERAQQLVRIAEQNGKKLVLLVNDLLDMEKLLAGKMQFEFKNQLVLELLKQSIDNMEAYAAQHKVTFKLDTHKTNIIVNVDGNRLQQVFINLLSNAAKFSPPHSTVFIHIYQLHNHVRIEVVDNGIGIALEAQKKLFQKFYQVDSSSTRNKNGTGLGLAISKELITAMHGAIGVNSDIGKGSCFYIELPTINTV